MDKERLVECLAAESWLRANFNLGTNNAGEMARRIRDDLRRISDSCMMRVGSRSNERKRKYWWTDEIGELWKESCLDRRRFGDRKGELLRRGGDYEEIVTDAVLLGLKAGWRALRVRVSPSNMEFKEGELEGAPERSGFGSVGFSVSHRDEEAAEFVGTVDGRHDGGVSCRSDRELFPRVAPYPSLRRASPSTTNATESPRGRSTSSSTRPPRSARLRARTACITGSSADLPG